MHVHQRVTSLISGFYKRELVQHPAVGNTSVTERAEVGVLSWWRTLPPAVCLITLFTLVTSQQNPSSKETPLLSKPFQQAKVKYGPKRDSAAAWVQLPCNTSKESGISVQRGLILCFTHISIENKHVKWWISIRNETFVWASGLSCFGWLNSTTSVSCWWWYSRLQNMTVNHLHHHETNFYWYKSSYH